MNKNWVEVWGQAHSNLSHFYYPSGEKTFRFILNCAISGEKIRIEISNEFARNDVHIGNITVAMCDKNGTFLSAPQKLTVNGKSECVLKEKESIFSDPVDISVTAQCYLAVSIYVKQGDLRSGNLLNNVELLTVKGDVTEEYNITNERRKRDTVIEVAGKVLNLFLHKPLPLLKSVQVLNVTGAASIIVLGDSLCQQGFWTNRLDERIRESFPDKYSLINKSIMGNRVLRDFSPRFPCKGLFGPSGMKRIERDILPYSDCKYVILALGTNDFLQYGTIAAPKNEKPDVKAVFEGVKQINDRLTENGKKVIIVNTVKFGECIDSRPEKEKMAEEYNRMLKDNSDYFYAVFDQASIVENPEKPNCTKKMYLGKDNLHFNQLGGKTVADSFDLSLFE